MKNLRALARSGFSLFLACVSTGCGGGSNSISSSPPVNQPPPGISTFAGTGVSGYTGDGALAGSAELNSPCGVSLDASGNVYIADTGNSVIRKVDSTGKITTIAGNGIKGYSGDGVPATSAALFNPYRVVADHAGNVYIADYNNMKILELR